jgi:hypothetical protein
MKNGLASASDDGTIKIYFEDDFGKKDLTVSKGY